MSISSMDEFEDQEDEEELLQRALEEQAQRELNYTRPPNHPPPVVSAAALGPPSRQPPAVPPRRPPPRPQPMEEEEESDVELLSLSSEDEDSQPRRKPSEVKRGTIDDDDDLDWDDDDEPDSWKRVDESELARMVREMRDTRLTAVSNLRRAPTFKRKASTIVETFPRGDDFMDPLGLGVIDIRNLTLVKEGAASVKNVDTDMGQVAAARDSSSREKVMYHSEKFDPKFFLCRIHQNTSHAELEAGEQSLKMDLQSRKQQLKQLVKENFDCFVSCKNTIDDIHSKLQQIEADIEGAGTVHLSSSIYEVDKVANQAFGPLFERQVQAERIRSVQGMLQRFRTLFNLPSTIRKYITKGEYDLAVREYKKAKSLVLPTHVRILKRVLEEVEKVISEFKDKMYKSMEDPLLEFSQLESTIRLLLELEPDSDPVWHYLNIKNSRIRSLLEGCSMEHEEQMEELKRRMLAKAQSDARWDQLQRRESNKGSDIDYTLLLGEHEKDVADESIRESTDEQEDVLLGRLIRRLTSVVVQHVPSFWRLALGIFNGRLAKVAQGVNTSKETHTKSGQQVTVARVADINCDKHSLDEVVAMIVDILMLYESKVLNAFLALTEANVLKPYMPKAVEEVSKACLAVESKDAAPPSAVQVLLVLKVQVTRHFLLRLCSFMRTATAKIGNEEEWVPVSAIERAGSPFAISTLPLKFQTMLVSALDHTKEIVERLKSKASDIHDMSVQVGQMQELVASTFFECFLLFRDSLDKVASELSQQCQVLDSERLDRVQGTMDNFFIGLQAGVEVINPHQKLLMILSNIGHCKNILLPDLVDKYQKAGLPFGKAKPGSDIGLEMVVEAFATSETTTLGQYVEPKGILIGTAAAAYFLEDGLQWGAAPPVKGIRDAAVELLHPLIAVHAELYAGANPYLDKGMALLVETLMEALSGWFNQNKFKAMRVVDLNGFSQLALEISYLEAVLRPHFTTAAHDALNTLRIELKEKVIETLREAETLGHRRSTTRGAEDLMVSEERLQNSTMTDDELNALEQQICLEFLLPELRRTRLNTVCFTDASEVLHSESESDGGTRHISARSMNAAGVILNHKSNLTQISSASRHRRWLSGSSLSDSESGKPSVSLPPQSPLSQSGYASSDVGSETGGNDSRARISTNNDRLAKAYSEARRPRRAVLGSAEDDLR